MARRIKSFGGQKQTHPLKDPKDIERMMIYFLKKRELAETPVKIYQADRNWMLCLIGLNTAFRAGDLLQLRVSDLIKGYVHIKESKTGKMQNFRLNKELHNDIKSYVERNHLTKYDYLFLGQKKKQGGKKYVNPITRQQAHSIVSKAANEVGISTRFGLHSLRKTFGFQYIKNGGNWATLMKMYNHDDIYITQLYVMWDINDAEKERAGVYLGGVHK